MLKRVFLDLQTLLSFLLYIYICVILVLPVHPLKSVLESESKTNQFLLLTE